jgi:hypothetical protein
MFDYIKEVDMNKKTLKKNLLKHNKDECSFKCNSGAFYGLGFLGSVIYYISTAAGFWAGVLGILKSLVWPAFLVYEVMKFLAI